MTPEEFIATWRGNTRTERAAAQQHFLDLCELLGVDKPGGPDYDFEKSTRKIGDTQGFSDVWRDRCFIWAAAYGWSADISEEEALARLLALNLERATQGR